MVELPGKLCFGSFVPGSADYWEVRRFDVATEPWFTVYRNGNFFRRFDDVREAFELLKRQGCPFDGPSLESSMGG